MRVSGMMGLKTACDRMVQQFSSSKVMAPLYSGTPKCWIKFWIMHSKRVEDQGWQIGFVSSVNSHCLWLPREMG